MFKVTFSDNRSIEVAASCEQAARNAAYRIDGGYAIVSVEVC